MFRLPERAIVAEADNTVLSSLKLLALAVRPERITDVIFRRDAAGRPAGRLPSLEIVIDHKRKTTIPIVRLHSTLYTHIFDNRR